MSKQIPWPRVLAEGAVIVASILLALAADAGWEGRKNAEAELRLLSDLRSEFHGHAAELERLLQATEVKRSASEALLAWMNGDAEFSVVVLDSLWGETLTLNGLDPGSGSYAAADAAGGLELIESGEVRAALADWPPLVDEVLSSEAGVREIVVGSLMPALAEAGAPLSRAMSHVYEWSAPVPGEARTSADYAEIRTSARVEGIVAYRYSWTTGQRNDYATAFEGVRAILRFLDAVIEG